MPNLDILSRIIHHLKYCSQGSHANQRTRSVVSILLHQNNLQISITRQFGTTGSTQMVPMDGADPETIISHLSWRSLYARRAMIEIRGLSTPNFLVIRPSSAALLDTLPLELLHLVLDRLDFQSLFSLLMTNTGCRSLVESFPPYKRTVTHAISVLAAMNRTKVLPIHSAAQVYTALSSESCFLCDDYGPFLFLLNAERCCLNCLRDNPSLRVFSLSRAAVCFGLARTEVAKLPSMRGLPGTYCVETTITHPTSMTLVSIDHARARGIQVHGSEVAMQAFVARKHALSLARYRQKSQTSRSRCPTSPSTYLGDPVDRFCGMASTPCPSLNVPDDPEHGLWCLGCHDEFDGRSRFQKRDFSGDKAEDEFARTQRLWSKACRAWSRSKFVDHVQHCQSAMSRFGKTGTS